MAPELLNFLKEAERAFTASVHDGFHQMGDVEGYLWPSPLVGIEARAAIAMVDTKEL